MGGIETALEEITLVLFTTLAPSGALAVALMGVPVVLGRCGREACQRINTWLCLPLVVTMVGLVASATHLGNPANALYVFLGVGRSPLSTEVFCAVVFLALAGMYWLYSFSREPRRMLQRIWMACIMVAGAVFVTSVAFAYQAETIASWNTPYVPVALWVNALMGGSLLALATLWAAGWRQAAGRDGKLLVALSALALAASVAVYALQAAVLPGIANGFGTAADLVPCYGFQVAAFAVLAAVGIGIDARMLFGRTRPAASWGKSASPDALDSSAAPASPDAPVSNRPFLLRAFLASALALAGIFIMRFAFYMMHMTV